MGVGSSPNDQLALALDKVTNRDPSFVCTWKVSMSDLPTSVLELLEFRDRPGPGVLDDLGDDHALFQAGRLGGAPLLDRADEQALRFLIQAELARELGGQRLDFEAEVLDLGLGGLGLGGLGGSPASSRSCAKSTWVAAAGVTVVVCSLPSRK